MQKYTAYIRSGVAVVISGILYVLFGIIILGLLMEVFPEQEDIFAAAVLFIVPPLSYYLAMLTAKSKMSITLGDDKMVLNVVRGSAANIYINTIQYNDIRFLQLKNSIAAGSYILLELAHGMRIKLYGKQFVINTNNNFYDLFLSLKKAFENKNFVQTNSIAEDTRAVTQEGIVPPIPEVTPQPVIVKQPLISINFGKEAVEEVRRAQHGWPYPYYKGSQFQCVTGIGIWVVFLLLFIVPITMGADSIVVTNWLVVLLVIWIMPMSLLLNYLGLTQEYIEIKKHNLPWFKKRIYLKEIKEIEINTYSYSGSVTILFKDFRYEKYTCPSIKQVQWHDLKKALEAQGVSVKVKGDIGSGTASDSGKAKKAAYLIYAGLIIFFAFFYALINSVDETNVVHYLLWMLFWLLLIGSGITLMFLIPWVYRKYK